jgi:hypothetical protein
MLDQFGNELVGKDTAALAAKEAYPIIPEIERAIAESRGDPRVVALYERLREVNNGLYDDLASLFYGQPDRSNIQRILNHPLLYWPLSYQIKATKWLARILFDKAFGVDTGFGGALVIQKVHDEHVARFQSDPEYQRWFAQHSSLLFIGQMLLPITPFDLGVSLSPFTRLALSAGNTDAYSRNLFGVGPGYTYFKLLPRLMYEEGKPGGVLGAGAPGPLPWLGKVGQQILPYQITVNPSTKSQLQAAEQAVVAKDVLGPLQQSP